MKGVNMLHKTLSLMFAAFIGVQLLSAASVKALEVLTTKELTSHCTFLVQAPEGVDGQYCLRYIQGFIDGAIATDARVMLNAESAISGTETFTERAMRTRIPNRYDRSRAAGLAGFCLGEPLQLREVVNVIVKDLLALQVEPKNSDQDEPAMEVVYRSLLKNYPCVE